VKDWDAGSRVRLSSSGIAKYRHVPLWDATWWAILVGDRNDPMMIAVRVRGEKKTRFINRKYLMPCPM
jgi:hypothetical protein